MTLLLSLIAGVVGAAAGWFVAGFATIVIGRLLGVSDFEGGLGMAAVWGIGPIGGLLGLIGGIVLVLRRRGGYALGSIAWRVPLVIAAIAGLVAGALWWMYETRAILNPNGLPPRLAFEVRLPATLILPDASRIKAELHTDKNRMPGQIAPEVRRDADGTAVLSGDVEVYYRAGWRLLEIKVPGQDDRIFKLDLPASPRRTTEFGAWQRAAFAAAPGLSEPRKAGPDESYAIRYRVRWPE